MRALSFGEILWDVYTDKKYLGGAPLNFAAHLARHGEEVYMISAVGEDDLGKEALSQLQKWNIATDYVSVCKEKQTGKCVVTLDENSIPTYNLLQDVAYDYIKCENASGNFDVLYFGTLALRSQNNCVSLKHLLKNSSFKEIFVDVNIRPPFYYRETLKFSLGNATVLKISFEELPTVLELVGPYAFLGCKEAAKYLADKYKNLSVIVITLGSDGAYALDCRTLKEYTCTGSKVHVKSTVGAGDSFSAAFLHKLFCGCNMQFCLEYAAKVAGYVVSQYDAVPNYKAEDFM